MRLIYYIAYMLILRYWFFLCFIGYLIQSAWQFTVASENVDCDFLSDPTPSVLEHPLSQAYFALDLDNQKDRTRFALAEFLAEEKRIQESAQQLFQGIIAGEIDPVTDPQLQNMQDLLSERLQNASTLGVLKRAIVEAEFARTHMEHNNGQLSLIDIIQDPQNSKKAAVKKRALPTKWQRLKRFFTTPIGKLLEKEVITPVPFTFVTSFVRSLNEIGEDPGHKKVLTSLDQMPPLTLDEAMYIIENLKPLVAIETILSKVYTPTSFYKSWYMFTTLEKLRQFPSAYPFVSKQKIIVTNKEINSLIFSHPNIAEQVLNKIIANKDQYRPRYDTQATWEFNQSEENIILDEKVFEFLSQEKNLENLKGNLRILRATVSEEVVRKIGNDLNVLNKFDEWAAWTYIDASSNEIDWPSFLYKAITEKKVSKTLKSIFIEFVGNRSLVSPSKNKIPISKDKFMRLLVTDPDVLEAVLDVPKQFPIEFDLMAELEKQDSTMTDKAWMQISSFAVILCDLLDANEKRVRLLQIILAKEELLQMNTKDTKKLIRKYSGKNSLYVISVSEFLEEVKELGERKKDTEIEAYISKNVATLTWDDFFKLYKVLPYQNSKDEMLELFVTKRASGITFDLYKKIMKLTISDSAFLTSLQKAMLLDVIKRPQSDVGFLKYIIEHDTSRVVQNSFVDLVFAQSEKVLVNWSDADLIVIANLHSDEYQRACRQFEKIGRQYPPLKQATTGQKSVFNFDKRPLGFCLDNETDSQGVSSQYIIDP